RDRALRGLCRHHRYRHDAVRVAAGTEPAVLAAAPAVGLAVRGDPAGVLRAGGDLRERRALHGHRHEVGAVGLAVADLTAAAVTPAVRGSRRRDAAGVRAAGGELAEGQRGVGNGELVAVRVAAVAQAAAATVTRAAWAPGGRLQAGVVVARRHDDGLRGAEHQPRGQLVAGSPAGAGTLAQLARGPGAPAVEVGPRASLGTAGVVAARRFGRPAGFTRHQGREGAVLPGPVPQLPVGAVT